MIEDVPEDKAGEASCCRAACISSLQICRSKWSECGQPTKWLGLTSKIAEASDRDLFPVHVRVVIVSTAI